MRCPKCQYIGFDSGDRCRNCGYEFALAAAEEPPLDVNIGREQPAPGRMHDLSLAAFDTPLAPLDSPEDTGRSGRGETPGGGRRPLTGSDLPLFIDRVADDQAPLVSPPAVPRPPLSVRRTNPGRVRDRSPLPEELSLDLDTGRDATDAADLRDTRHDEWAPRVASLPRRVGAGLIDLFVLGAIGAAVLFLTLHVSELTVDEWRVLPLAPLAAFLLLLCGGYVVLFTAAGGQTIGKMATRIRVVGMSEDGRSLSVSFGTAMVRAMACLGSVVALGAGFLPALISPDRRAFHDRIAETRVVPA